MKARRRPVRHYHRALVVVLLAAGMVASGCFHASPRVNQTMTDAATGAEEAAGAGEARAPAAHFDLHKPEVDRRVVHFQTNLRGFFGRAMVRGAKYVTTMEDMLASEGLPTELAYLPLIESGYRPEAVSPKGAAGPWQFIPATGRRYGLRIDSLVDERRDPIKSTQAAAQYLKELHRMFGDWELSLAAYNSGENRVARIIAATDAADFWDMRRRGYLPRETSEYVPRFLAAVRIAKAPESYGFEQPLHVPFHFETVHVNRQVSLHTAARLSGVSTAELAALNPALRRGITPSRYALRVPTGAAAPLRAALASYSSSARPARTVASASRASGRRTVTARAGNRSNRTVSRPARKTAGQSAARSANRPKKPAVVQKARGGSRTPARSVRRASPAPKRPAQSARRAGSGDRRLANVRTSGKNSKGVVVQRSNAPKNAAVSKQAQPGKGKPSRAAASGRR